MFKNKIVYEGEFTLNNFNGKGTYYYPNGDKYEGHFSNGLRHGSGVYHYANGDRYTGTWYLSFFIGGEYIKAV